VIVLVVLVAVSSAIDIGDRVEHTFLKFDALPLTQSDADDASWMVYSNCTTGIGIAFTYKGQPPTSSYPVVVYFSAGGQISSIGVRIFGTLPGPLVPEYYKPADSDSMEVTVSFRDPDSVCDPTVTFNEVVGDRLVINPDTVAFPIPIAEGDAVLAGWSQGGCIGGMGTHYSYDLLTTPVLSFNATTMVPVTPMYFNGSVSAFLISSPQEQEIIPLIGAWEGPFPLTLWCYNWCSSQCSPNFDTYSGWWSSMHFLLHDHTINTCAQHCATSDDDGTMAAAMHQQVPAKH